MAQDTEHVTDLMEKLLKSYRPVALKEVEEIEQLAKEKEGEDFNLEQWKEKTLEYLNDEADILGYEVVPNLKLVYQTFKVVYK
jgi:uncharacterized protein YhfF